MHKEKQDLLRKIPSVDRIYNTEPIRLISKRHPRNVLLSAIRKALDELRKDILSGIVKEEDLETGNIIQRVLKKIEELDKPSLKRVINATGVITHTNLGRSILAKRVLERLAEIGGSYSNLEYDLEKGKRGLRYVHVEYLLKELTSAESAMVVNNNAAAVLISLETLAKGKKVIVSRGELVEIGGSFRIPEVMKKSGAYMIEVGTTNKTHLRDYEEAIDQDTALLLKVHKSNFSIVGFTEEVPLKELVLLGKKHGIPVMEDLGSGCFVDFSEFGLMKEPTVQEVVAQGADIVTFSGDKLLGGPQAGIIVGKKKFVEAIRKNQLNRALRIDKLTLVALEETLRLYRDKEQAIKEIPTLSMICESYNAVKKKAKRLLRLVKKSQFNKKFSVSIQDGSSMVGGGALPLCEIKSALICIEPKGISETEIEKFFRTYDPPIICRVERGKVFLDMRTVQDKELNIVADAINQLAKDGQQNA